MWTPAYGSHMSDGVYIYDKGNAETNFTRSPVSSKPGKWKRTTLNTVLMEDSQGHRWCPVIVGGILCYGKPIYKIDEALLFQSFDGSLISNECVYTGDHILRIRLPSKAAFCYPNRSGTRSAGRAGKMGPVIRLWTWSKPWEYEIGYTGYVILPI